MKDNYAKNISISCLIILLMSVFMVGLVSGYAIVIIDDVIADNHRNNLIKMYGVKK